MVACTHVPVPGGLLQVGSNLIMVKTAKPAHEVVCRPDLLPQVRMQGLQLVLLELAVTCRDKSLELEHQGRVVCPDGDWDLLPGRVCLAPVCRRPTPVERHQRAVFLSQELLEELAAAIAITHAVIFIVDLPAYHIGMVAELCAQGLDDAPGGSVHLGRIDTVVAAVPELN